MLNFPLGVRMAILGLWSGWLTACSTGIPAGATTALTPRGDALNLLAPSSAPVAGQAAVSIADTQADRRSPASLTFQLRAGLRTQVKTLADMKSLRFCLLESPTNVSPAGGTDLVPVGGSFSFDTDTAVRKLTFTNLRANVAGCSYYIAVAAFDGPGGSGANITNITGDDLAKGRVTLQGMTGSYYVTNGGGDTTGSRAGSVRVEPVTYAMSATAALTVNLQLQD